MSDARSLLEEYVGRGKVMQLATLTGDGSPVVCNLFFAATLTPDRLYFISRPTRDHCANIRADARVAGAILAIDVEGVGQAVRGVTFTATAVELPTTGIDAKARVYADRWPAASNAIDPARLASGAAHHRVYELMVAGWVLYDEENFAGQPRQPVRAA